MEEGIKGANNWSRVLGSGFAHSNSAITDLSNQPCRSRAEDRLFPGLLVTPPIAACGLIFPRQINFLHLDKGVKILSFPLSQKDD